MPSRFETKIMSMTMSCDIDGKRLLQTVATMFIALMLLQAFGHGPAAAQAAGRDPAVAPAPDGGAGLIDGGPAAPPGGRAISVYVFGDSLASGVWRGLDRAFAGDNAVRLENRSKGSSGLVRSDFYDWNAEMASVLESAEMDIAIVMLGSNDRQRLRRTDGGYEFGDPEFRRIYTERVDQLMQQLRRHGALVYWLGLPNMRGKTYARAMNSLNEIYKERAEVNGVNFVPTWDEFSDAVGAFSPYGEDISGTVRLLRADDGVHFTNRGYRKLASLVERQVRDFLATGPVVKGERVFVRGEPDEQMDEGGDGAATPRAEDALQDIGVGRPGVDAVRDSAKAEFQATSPAYKVLTLGEAIEPKPGRGDDFSWGR
jgi:hypothetical protein